MKYTLLKIVQDILSSINGDFVNSIGDTDESMAIALIVQNCYDDIIARGNLPEHYSLFELNASGDNNLPTVMYAPSNMKTIEWIKYDKKETTVDDPTPMPSYQKITYKPLDDFMNSMYLLNVVTDGTVDNYPLTLQNGSDTIELLWYNNKHPTYYTTFNDHTILFDSFLNTEDSTLQKNKTVAYGSLESQFSLIDTYVPVLDTGNFNLLLQESRASAWAELKQTENVRAEKKARQGWINLQVTKRGIKNNSEEFDKLPNYGRRR